MAQGLTAPEAPAARAPCGRVFAVVAVIAACFALTLLVLFPGYMTNDAAYVYDYIKAWSLGDWQSPIMTILWSLIDPIAPGSASMFLLFATLYWLAFGIVALTVARRSLLLGLAVPLLALLPPAFAMLAMIWRDVLFAIVWLLAAGIVYAAAERQSRMRIAAQALAILLLALGVLLRPNAVIAAPILLTYLLSPARFDWKLARVILIPAAMLAYGLVHLVYYGILDVKREHPLHSIMVFDLGGITHFAGENQFPVPWSAEENSLLTGKCYNPDRWDSYWTIPPCQFVMARLERGDDKIFGTLRLTDAWVGAAVTHPLAYLRHRLTYSWALLAGTSVTLELYNLDDPAKAPLARNPYFRTLVAVHDVLKPTPLFRAGFWLIFAAAVTAWAWPARATPAGAFAVGVTASSVVYLMTFVPVGVAGDFRYAYWCVLASLAGIVPMLLARRTRLAHSTEQP